MNVLGFRPQQLLMFCADSITLTGSTPSCPFPSSKSYRAFCARCSVSRLLKGWETPHLGCSAKACQINGDLPSLTTPEVQVIPRECGVQVYSTVACFQQQGWVWSWMGSPADSSAVGTGTAPGRVQYRHSTGRVWALGAPHGITTGAI